MSHVITSLALLDPHSIRFHESHENVRLEKVCRSIEQEGSLRNPPLVSVLDNGDYLLLDGAHRMMAMLALNCQRVAVQVVPDQQIGLDAWDHIVPSGDWWALLKQDDSIAWSDEPLDGRLLARVTEANGSVHYLYPSEPGEDLFTHLDAWHRIVVLYQHEYIVRRVPHGVDLQPGNGEVLLSYPEYTLGELKQVVQAGRLMPAGVTRSMVQGRLLNLHIPLELMRAEQFQAEEWERMLQNWSQSLRFYTEPVYMCEA
ncbi:MAG TPA: ParB N-terminal domain-containing protein [Bacilli bacterium]|nr:ParB N-terminal domain-containing protein [Bacilli bacterium]